MHSRHTLKKSLRLLTLGALLLLACRPPGVREVPGTPALQPPAPVRPATPPPLETLTFPPPGTPFHPFLPPLHSEGRSVGTTRDGYLIQAARLPLEHPALRVMPRQYARGLFYGTTDLVAALVDAGEVVSMAHPGSVLSLGHLSGPFGGDIPYSVSHNAGRDADIAFFYQDKAGNPVLPDDFIELNSRGRSANKHVIFDTPRTWTLVRTLLLSPYVRVQWLFLSHPLRAALLEHARALEEPPTLIARAEELLGQPGDGRPHNDHLHLRVLCSDEDLAEGCQDMGRIPSGERDPQAVTLARIEAVASYLTHADPERRARAAELLGILRATTFWSEILEMLDDAAPRVRASAARGLELLLPWMDQAPQAGGALGLTSGATSAASARVASTSGESGESMGGEGEQTPTLPPTPPALDSQGPTLDEPGASEEGLTPELAPVPTPPLVPVRSEPVTPDPLRAQLLEESLLLHLVHEPDPVVIEAWLGVLVRARSRGLPPVLIPWLSDDRRFFPGDRTVFPGGGLPRDTFPGLPPLPSRGFPLTPEVGTLSNEPLELKMMAALALAELREPSAIPPLLDYLNSTDATQRDWASKALDLLTNRRALPEALSSGIGAPSSEPGADSRSPSPAAESPVITAEMRAQAHKRVLELHPGEPLETWWLEGFREAGYPVPQFNLRGVPMLIRALDAPMPVALNAHFLLERLTGVRMDRPVQSFEDIQVFWARHYKRNASRYGTPPSPAVRHHGKAKAGSRSKAKASKKATAGKKATAAKKSSAKKSSSGKAKKSSKSSASSKKPKSSTKKKSRK